MWRRAGGSALSGCAPPHLGESGAAQFWCSAPVDFAGELPCEGPVAPGATVAHRRAAGVGRQTGGEQQTGGYGREEGEGRDDPPSGDVDGQSLSGCVGGDRLGAGLRIGDSDGDSPCRSPVCGISALCETVSNSRRIPRGGTSGHPPTYGFCYLFRPTRPETAPGDRRPKWSSATKVPS